MTFLRNAFLCLGFLGLWPGHAVAQSGYVEGEVLPHRLFAISATVARTQTFAADGEAFADLQFMLSTDEPGEGRLVVEVRTPDLSRRLGIGHVAAGDTEFGWKSVEWREPPSLTVDDTYAFVLRTETGGEARWFVASSEADVYPWGEGPTFTYSPRSHGTLQKDGGYFSGLVSRRMTIEGIDLAFRARYEDGEVTHSPFLTPVHTPRRWHISAKPREPRETVRVDEVGPPLPMCIGNKCADPTENLVGSSRERRSRAKENFEQCGPSMVRMKTWTNGLSCRDVCDAFGFADCRRTIGNDVSTCSTNAYSSVRWCDAIIGDEESSAQMACQCSEEKMPPGRLYTPARERRRRRPAFATVGKEGIFVHNETSKVVIIEAGKKPSVRSYELPRRYRRAKFVEDWVLFKDQDDVLTLAPDGTKTVQSGLRECEYSHVIRFRGSPWVTCFYDDLFYLYDALSDEVLEPPIAPEYYRRGPPVGVGDELYFLGAKHRYTWRPGESEWTKLGASTSLRHPKPSKVLGEILDEIYRKEPGFPGFVDGVYYGDTRYRGNAWAYDTRKKQFLHSDLRVSYDVERSSQAVRYDDYLLDEESGEFRRAPVPANASWSGRFALVAERDCPEGYSCEKLPAPFEEMVVVEFDPASLASRGAIRMHPLALE